MLILMLLVAAVASGITYLVMSRWRGLFPAVVVWVLGVTMVLGLRALFAAYTLDVHLAGGFQQFEPFFMALEGGVPLGIIAGMQSARRKRQRSAGQ